MKTIYELQQIADRLRASTEVNSISPEDTFGLQADVLEYLADMEQNAEGLGIHQVYASYAAMLADASAPVGSNGKPLRFGQLVVIYDSSNTTQAESGNVYAWQKGYTGASAWKLMGNLGNVHSLQSQIDSLLSSDESMKGKLTELEASTTSLRLSAQENTHIMLPFLKNGVKLRLTDLNASTNDKLYLRKVVNSIEGQVAIGMIQNLKSKEVTLEGDYSCIFVYDPKGVDVSFSVTLLDGNRVESIETLLNSVKSIQDGLVTDVQNTSANIAKVDAKVDAMHDGLQFSYTSETGLQYKYFYQSFLKQGTKLNIKNLKNEHSIVYFRYQESVNNQLTLTLSPNEERTLVLERDYDSIFLYWENYPNTWNFLFKVISSADETLTSLSAEVMPIIEKVQDRGTEVAASSEIAGKYIESNGNLSSLGSFIVYSYEVEPNKYYFIHSSLVVGSARVFAVYSSDEFSASTALMIGPSPTAPREDYVLVKMPSNAKYVGISYYNGSEHSVFESKVISVSDLKKDVDSLKAKEMPSSLNTCVELASNGEDLFISYLNPNKTEITIWFKKCMFNELYTFYMVGYRDVNRLYADTIGISSQTGITQINSTSSDNIGPLSFHPGGWAGGNHSWSDDNVTKTARCDSFAIKVDGYAITPGEKVYGKKVQVDVVNTIFDPSIAPEAGATILSTPISTELVKYVVEKGNIEVSIKESFVQETTTKLNFYYGMQSMFYGEAKFITPNGQYADWQNADGTQKLTFSKASYPKFNRFIEKNGSSTAYQGTYLLPNKDGNHDKTTINVFNRSYGKTYHIVVNNTNSLPIAGSKIVWSGVYSFFKNALVDNDDILVYEGLINGKDAIFVWTKRAFSGAVQLPQIYSMRVILDVEKDSTITTDNAFVDSDGININATGAGSWIFVVE